MKQMKGEKRESSKIPWKSIRKLYSHINKSKGFYSIDIAISVW